MSRQSTSAARPFETLEGRQLFAVSVSFVAPDTLNFNGDAQADTLVINDNGAPFGAISGLANNAAGTLVPFGFGGIRKINIKMGANDDKVQYRVTGDMLFGSVRYISAFMEDGRDSFALDMGADIDLGPNSFVNVRASGGNDNDEMTCRYLGELDGQLSVTFDAGAGSDVLTSDAKLDFGSSGHLNLGSYGGLDDDSTYMAVRKANPFDPVTFNAFSSGGGGLNDKLTRTASVLDDITTEFVSVIP